MEKNLSILTKQQRTAYTLRMQGLTFQKIADTMGISANGARQHVRNAERRFREYDRFHAVQTKNATPVTFPLTRGDLKLMLEGLYYVKHKLEHLTPMRVHSDWLGRLPYEHQLVEDLVRRVETAIFGHPLYEGLGEGENANKNTDASTGFAEILEDSDTAEKP